MKVRRGRLLLLSLILLFGSLPISNAAKIGSSCKTVGEVKGPLICLSKLNGKGASWQRVKSVEDIQSAISLSLTRSNLPKELKPSLKDARTDKSSWLDQACAVDFPDVVVPECVAGDANGRKSMVVYGDSHASMWLSALDIIAKKSGYKIHLFAKLACPLVEETVWSYQLNRPFKECTDWQRAALSNIEEISPDILVVTDQFKPAVVDGKKSDFDTPFMWEREFPVALKRLNGYAKRLVVIGNNPSMQQDSVTCASKPRVDITQCTSARNQAGNVRINKIEADAAMRIKATFIDTVDLACSDYLCPIVVGDKFVYFDQWHFTDTYVRWLTPVLERLLKL